MRRHPVNDAMDAEEVADTKALWLPESWCLICAQYPDMFEFRQSPSLSQLLHLVTIAFIAQIESLVRGGRTGAARKAVDVFARLKEWLTNAQEEGRSLQPSPALQQQLEYLKSGMEPQYDVLGKELVQFGFYYLRAANPDAQEQADAQGNVAAPYQKPKTLKQALEIIRIPNIKGKGFYRLCSCTLQLHLAVAFPLCNCFLQLHFAVAFCSCALQLHFAVAFQREKD